MLNSLQYKNGLCLGKFMPPHNGHLHLIHTALLSCEHVYVMVCYLKDEPIHGKLRYHWLTQIFKGNNRVTVVECDDENPQEPKPGVEYDEEFYAIWNNTVYSHIPHLDVVFTSEEYGDNFAKSLGVTHELVDLGRITYPVSGTLIREATMDYWDFIPDEVKGYFLKKIAIVGPESTGKSTLTRDLECTLGLQAFGEFGRTYTDNFNDNFEMDIDDYNTIAMEHLIGVNSMNIIDKDGVVISDTEAIVTKTFAKMYMGDDIETEFLDNIIEKQNYDLYLLLKPNVLWVDDGTRDFPEQVDREKHYGLIKAELDARGFNYIIIDGEYDGKYSKNRFIQAHTKIEEFLNKVLVIK